MLLQRLLKNRPLNIAQLYCRLGWYEAAYKRAKALLSQSNYNRLYPGWNRKRHERLESFVNAFKVCPDCRAHVPEDQEVCSNY